MPLAASRPAAHRCVEKDVGPPATGATQHQGRTRTIEANVAAPQVNWLWAPTDPASLGAVHKPRLRECRFVFQAVRKSSRGGSHSRTRRREAQLVVCSLQVSNLMQADPICQMAQLEAKRSVAANSHLDPFPRKAL